MANRMEQLVNATRTLAGLGHGQPATLVPLSRPGATWTELGVVPGEEVETVQVQGRPSRAHSATQTPTLTLRYRPVRPDVATQTDTAMGKRDQQAQTERSTRKRRYKARRPDTGTQTDATAGRRDQQVQTEAESDRDEAPKGWHESAPR